MDTELDNFENEQIRALFIIAFFRQDFGLRFG
jgi:hypothetical protein